ncbi:MAG: peptidyl-tRNA hydrolase Pth2 [Candidatus Methanomethylophilaceae archaeon]
MAITTSDEAKMVIVVRADLKLSKGKAAAQVAHAAVNCAFASKKKDPRTFDRWFAEGQKKVVLKVQDLRQLYEIKAMADASGLVNSLITDAGRTEIDPGTVTCLGIGPSTDDVLDRITGGLSML